MAERNPGLTPSTAASEAEQETLELLAARLKFQIVLNDGSGAKGPTAFELAGARAEGR
jgi:hypothetical protein